MAITNDPKASGASFTLDTWKDSVTGNQVQKVILADAAAAGSITPALETGGNLAQIKTNTTLTTAGTPATSGLPVQGMTGGVPIPVSATSMPLPTGAAQDGTDATGVTPPAGAAGIRGWLSSIYNKTNTSIAVTGTFWQTTQPVSAATLPLPAGASTAAKQPALGTAGAASADVLTVQGISSMIALKVDGSAVTQPISAASLPLPAGAATAALQPTAAGQGSATSGQTGHLMQGAVTTSAPTYTTAQTSPLSLDTTGSLRVNVTAGGASGNVGQASTTSGETGPLIQGAVTTAAPSYTTGQTNPLSLDTAGNLRVNVVTGVGTGNVAQGSTTSGETGPLIQGAVSTSSPSYTNAQTSPLSLTTTGRLRIDGSGTLQPVSQAAASIVDGANVALGTTTDPIWTTGAATVIGLLQAINSAAGSALPAGTNIIGDVRNITGSVPLPTGAATLAGQVSPLAQASTTSGQTGAMVMGATTTSAPTYVTAKTNPLSLTTAGGLRVDGSGATQPVSQSGTWTVQPGNTANTTAWKVDGSAVTQPTSVADGSNVTIGALADAAWVSGSGSVVAILKTISGLQPSNVTQGVAIGSLTGTMMMAEALTSAPQPTTATVIPLNTDGSGCLRVTNGSISQVQTPTVTSNGAYTAGQLVGSKLTYSLFTTSATIQSITVTSESLLTANLAAYIFHSSPSGTYSDKAAPAITQADKVKLLAVVPLTNPSNGFGTHTVWWASGLNLNLANNTFYVYIMAVDALTLTATSTSEVACRVTLRS